MNIYESDEDAYNPSRTPVSRNSEPRSSRNNTHNNAFVSNYFALSDEQKVNINKRLPAGFCLIQKKDLEGLKIEKKYL